MSDYFVPNWQIFCYRTFKAPFFSSVWFVLLVYTIWNPFETLPTVLGIVFLFVSFSKYRLLLGTLSPIPCIATVILAFGTFNNALPVILLICGIAWFIVFSIAILVWSRISKEIYVFDPVSRHLHYEPHYYLLKDMKK